MSEINSGLLVYLAELAEANGNFNVVSQRVEGKRVYDDYYWEELPIAHVIADESDSELCLVRRDGKIVEGAALNVESFFLVLQAQLEQHLDFTVVVSEWFQIDEEHTGRIDIPLDSVEVDEDARVLRLQF